MRGLLILAMKHKAIALAVAVALSGGSAATFASQDNIFRGTDSSTLQVVGQAETPTSTPTEVSTPTSTPTEASQGTPTSTPTEAGQGTPTATSTEASQGTPTSTPTEVNEATPTPSEGQRTVVGIPDSNPSKHPEDGDGVCDKGETVIKIVPSGRQVNVPCQAVKPHGNKSHNNQPTPTQTEQP
jgi:hypothetical protein